MTWWWRKQQEHIEVWWQEFRRGSVRSVVEQLDDGLLIYDLKTNHAHSLSAEAARVWRCRSEERRVGKEGARAGVEEETTHRALAELEACRLLDSSPGRREGSTRHAATI